MSLFNAHCSPQKKMRNVNVFYHDMWCPFTASFPCPHGHGSRGNSKDFHNITIPQCRTLGATRHLDGAAHCSHATFPRVDFRLHVCFWVPKSSLHLVNLACFHKLDHDSTCLQASHLGPLYTRSRGRFEAKSLLPIGRNLENGPNPFHYKEMVPDMTDSWRKNVRIDEGSVLQASFCHFGV